MAVGVNKCIMVGNLCKDPEVRFAQSGTAVCNLRIAVSERVKIGDDWQDKAEFVTVVAFGKTAENVGQYLAKGRQVYVEGRLQTRTYKDKDGNDKYATEVVANIVLFLGGGKGDAPAKGEATKGDAAPAAEGFDSDLPF